MATFVTVNQTYDFERENLATDYQIIEKGYSKAERGPSELKVDDTDPNGIDSRKEQAIGEYETYGQ